MKNYFFRQEWQASLALALLLPLFVYLGFWQLRRAEEKERLMDTWTQRQAEPVLGAGSLGQGLASLRFRRIELEGDWDGAHQFLLDNQIANQLAGYHVLTPLRTAGGEAVLVNRGWLGVGKDRRRLPDIVPAHAHVRISGVIDKLPEVGFKLKGAEIPTVGWPSVVQLADPSRLAERLEYPLSAYQVLLAPDAVDGYVREWKQASLNPGKNRGYALQWFGFALAIVILYLWHGFKKASNVPPVKFLRGSE